VPEAKRTVLVIEDEPGIRAVIRELLSEEGYEVLEEEDPVAALTLAEQIRPIVILLDLLLPRGSGTEFLRRYRERVADPAPVIVTTAVSDLPEGVENVAAVLPKPFDLDVLLALVDTHARG
jgi:DNA-binding response OmpR family regulator